MNPEAQKVLEDILKKNPEDLTEWEVRFLKGRRAYLTNEQVRIFAVPLGEKVTKPVKKPESTPVAPVEPVGQADSAGTKGVDFEDSTKDPDVVK